MSYVAQEQFQSGIFPTFEAWPATQPWAKCSSLPPSSEASAISSWTTRYQLPLDSTSSSSWQLLDADIVFWLAVATTPLPSQPRANFAALAKMHVANAMSTWARYLPWQLEVIIQQPSLRQDNFAALAGTTMASAAHQTLGLYAPYPLAQCTQLPSLRSATSSALAAMTTASAAHQTLAVYLLFLLAAITRQPSLPRVN